METCNACDAVAEMANSAGWCADCLGAAEDALNDRLQSGEITFEEYQREFAAMHD